MKEKNYSAKMITFDRNRTLALARTMIHGLNADFQVKIWLYKLQSIIFAIGRTAGRTAGRTSGVIGWRTDVLHRFLIRVMVDDCQFVARAYNIRDEKFLNASRNIEV